MPNGVAAQIMPIGAVAQIMPYGTTVRIVTSQKYFVITFFNQL
jgi:hypothetical protein